MIHPNAAAIDVGATLHMAAVRADRATEPVRSFGTFTTDLHRLVDWFTECGVETIVMELVKAMYEIPSLRKPELRTASRVSPFAQGSPRSGEPNHCSKK
jgi:hypothetical protein